MKILALTNEPSFNSTLSPEEFLKLARAHFHQPGRFMEEFLRQYEILIDRLAEKDEEISDRESEVEAREAVIDDLQETHHQFNCPGCGVTLELDLELDLKTTGGG